MFFPGRQQKLAMDPCPSGRTWLRTMLSSFLQHRFGLQVNELLDNDNYHRMDPIIPRIRFSHVCYANPYIDNRDSKRDYYNEKAALMVRDPQDVVASNHPQWVNSASSYRKNLLNIPQQPRGSAHIRVRHEKAVWHPTNG
jgi:hypothetical protein